MLIGNNNEFKWQKYCTVCHDIPSAKFNHAKDKVIALAEITKTPMILVFKASSGEYITGYTIQDISNVYHFSSNFVLDRNDQVFFAYRTAAHQQYLRVIALNIGNLLCLKFSDIND